jgi:hypothetical protein
MATEKAAAPARKPLWTYLAGIVAVFMISMDNLVVTNALPVISAKLHTGLEGLEWTINGYTLTFAVLMLTGAALGDRYGIGNGEDSKDLGGSSNLNLLLTGTGGRGRYVVRVYRPWVTAARLADMQLVRRRLALGGVPCARAGLATAGLGAALGPVIGGAVTRPGPGSGSSGSTCRAACCCCRCCGWSPRAGPARGGSTRWAWC